MKKFKVICKTCGEIECDPIFTNWGEEDFIVPVSVAKTLQALCRIYKKERGSTYEHDTGNKPKDDFDQKVLMLNHEDLNDLREEDFDKHNIGEHLCWTLDL